jgi:hypothetical protein
MRAGEVRHPVQQFAVVASLTTLALSAFVCLRLLRVAWRTRGAPEIAMGTYQALVVAAIAVYASLRERFLTRDPSELFAPVCFANLLIGLGVVALAVGVWRIYRPAERWAMAACALLSLWVMGGWLWTSLGDVLPTTVAPTPANAFFVAGRGAVYLWGGFEGFRYYGMMRRRAALGLGDPMIAHQILLWGTFSLLMGLLAVTSLTAGMLLREAYAQWSLGPFITPTLSLLASICLWLGFFPPAFYRRRIAGVGVPAAG